MVSTDTSELVERIKEKQSQFIIGTAASAHQVEGYNHNDWTLFEKANGNISTGEISGKATDHYHRYKEDFSILENLGYHAHRLSIEWSRIFPKPREIDWNEISHYKDVLKSLKENHQLSFVTLHHFTSPIWFIQKGGFTKTENLQYWINFVRVICEELGEYIDVFNTINEPFVYAATGYLQGVHSPGDRSITKYIKVCNNLIRAHFQAVDIIREMTPEIPVGIVKNLIFFDVFNNWSPIDRLIRRIADWGYNTAGIKALKEAKIPFGFKSIENGDVGDFVGVNYYVHMTVGISRNGLILPANKSAERLTDMGWSVDPKSMEKEIRRLYKELKLPIIITENGIATENDRWRIDYIEKHMNSLADLLDEGIDIRGYFYWSFIDNFEWSEGFEPKFGLISFEPNTFERETKPSSQWLGGIAQKFHLKVDDFMEELRTN